MVSIVYSSITKQISLLGAESCITLVTFQNPAPALEATYPGVVAVIEQAYSRQSVSASAIKIIISSLAASSLKQYNCTFKKWWKFCIQYQINVFESNIPKVIDFLVSEYESGANYSTLNTCRSALALILGKQISQDDRLLRFMKGVYRTKPCFPKYEKTWNPNLVLDHLSNFYPNESQSLDMLTKKLVALLALSTAQRTQTLSLIRLSNVEVGASRIEICVNDIIKTSAPNRPPPNLIIPFFPHKEQICPAKTLSAYIELTKSFRNHPRTDRLILTTKKPFHNASASTISRWIKQILSDSGVDTNVYSAHSTRHASTSAAKRKGVSIEIIKQTAGWSGNSLTFARFYNRPITNDEGNVFAEAIYD